MMRRNTIRLKRYLDAGQFLSELRKLKAFKELDVGSSLLEELEELNLIGPVLRLKWPDPVARRIWQETDRSTDKLIAETEPDGQRWDAAVDLYTALEWTDSIRVHYDRPHPLDEPKAEWRQFLQLPCQQVFKSHRYRRVSVASERHPEFFDSRNIRDFYSSWQLLLAGEVADMGVRIRLNMADGAADGVISNIRRGRLPDGWKRFELFAPSREIRNFRDHRAALDALVWFEEEASIGLGHLLKGNGGGRFVLTKEQSDAYQTIRSKAANGGCLRYKVGAEEIQACCGFLAERWSEWDRQGRPFIADAYKTFIAAGVRLLQQIEGWDFTEIKNRVGRPGGHRKPTLEVIWPDWATDQISRLTRTLGNSGLNCDQLAAFGQFLIDNYVDSVFLRLESFEFHAFEGAGSPLAGMKSDLQGMAVAVEQAVRAMGGKDTQLHKMFRKLWAETDVAKLLKDHKTLLEQARRPEEIMAEIDKIRDGGGASMDAADLILAARVRGAVHHALTIDDQPTLERLFVSVLRAAAITHAHCSAKGCSST